MEVWRGQQEGLQTVIVNPGVILGPTPKIAGKDLGSGEIFEAVANDLPFYTKGTSGFIAVTDVVRIMHKLMKSELSAERYTLIEDNYGFDVIANTIADALKVKRPSIHAKPWMTSLSWKIDWLLALIAGKKRMIYKDMATSLHATDRFSNAKIREALNVEFKPVLDYIREVVEIQKSR